MSTMYRSSTGYTSSFAHYKQDTLYSTPILLVDDDIDLLYAFELILKDEGYKNVKTYPDAKSALKYTMGNIKKYKLAILDIRMPDINGIQLYQMLKILNPSIKVMFITSLDSVKELASIFSEVTDKDILRKPVHQKQLIETVNNKVSTLLLL